MKHVLPILLALAGVLIATSAIQAQSRIFNPNLPNDLVFQWKIAAKQVDPSWPNDDFFALRTEDGYTVYYGTYSTLEAALADADRVKGQSAGAIKLIPFFNQRSIDVEDALALLGNAFQNQERVESEIVSFTVYFGTYDQTVSLDEVDGIDCDLSFEVQSNRTLAYSWGQFASREAAEKAAEKTRQAGYETVQVQRYLNGRRIASLETEELSAYLAFNDR